MFFQLPIFENPGCSGPLVEILFLWDKMLHHILLHYCKTFKTRKGLCSF